MPRTPSASRIHESHETLRRVMSGEVTPHCQKAQAAYKVARQYPEPVYDEPEDSTDWLTTIYEGARTPPIVETSRRPVPALTPEQARDASADKDVFLKVLFGSAAPQADKALDFLQSKRGQQVLGVGVTALGTLLTVRMVS